MFDFSPVYEYRKYVENTVLLFPNDDVTVYEYVTD
jgi:hypothetical protein